MRCPYSGKCWRLAYSRYFQHSPYEQPPNRWELIMSGDAAAEMVSHSKRDMIYCENMPGRGGNMCPDLVGRSFEDCHEYKKETRALENLKRENQRREERVRRGAARPRIPKKLRIEVTQRARYKCQYCGVALGKILDDGTRVKCQVDHRVPLTQGGAPLCLSNLVLACARCNREKSDSIWEIGCKLPR